MAQLAELGIIQQVEEVILQGTPFCNLDRRYCYLGDRSDRSSMSEATLRRIGALLASLRPRSSPTPVIWHAGEPLVLPVRWYERAHRILSEGAGADRLQFGFQTNGTLIDRPWVDFFQSDPSIQVGISIDGPAFIHDARRKSRRGEGTHERVMRGVRRLRDGGIPFHCIAVVTDAALDHPDEFFEFFAELGATALGLNPEELEGANLGSSMSGLAQEARYRRFLRRLTELHLRHPSFQVREFARVEAQVERSGPSTSSASLAGNRMTIPWRLISFDWQGNVHTFAPELLGVGLPGVGPALGNVHRQRLEDIAHTSGFERLRNQIERGRRRCSETCAYYPFCGGGSPANKWFEHQSLEVAETVHCRLAIQAPLDEYLSARLEMSAHRDA